MTVKLIIFLSILKNSKALNYTKIQLTLMTLNSKKDQNLITLFLDQAQNLEKMIMKFL